MKKIIAVLIALAMVLSMSVMAFAEFGGISNPSEIVDSQEEFDKAATLEDWQISDYANWWNYIDKRNEIANQGIYTKEDGSIMTWDEAWAAYCAYVASNITSDPTAAAPELIAIVQGGYLPAGDVISIVGQSIMGGIGGDGESGDLSGIIDQIIGGITGGEQEPEVTVDEYVDELTALINSGASVDEITKKIGEDLASGKIVTSQIPDIARIIAARVEAGEIENNETVQKILEFMENIGSGDTGMDFPSFGDITLPWDNGNSESGSFLDTILGIIGSIGDLFNPTPDEPTTPDVPTDPGNTDIPDTGDVSFVAVAAVAAVAGAALVLTRKKNDAE